MWNRKRGHLQCYHSISSIRWIDWRGNSRKWYASLMLGLGTHLEQVNSSIEAIFQMGLTKRETKKDEFHAHKKGKSQPLAAGKQPPRDQRSVMGSEMSPWTAWISQIKLNEQEVPEFFRTSDDMKQWKHWKMRRHSKQQRAPRRTLTRILRDGRWHFGLNWILLIDWM